MTINNETKSRTLLTVSQFADKHKAFTEGSLRHLIFHANSNGFSNCVKRVGRKILLDEQLFFDWVDQSNSK